MTLSCAHDKITVDNRVRTILSSGKKCAIQVAYSVETAEDREIKSLILLAKKTKGIERLIIITNEEERTITENDITIEVLHAFKFLLSKDI